MAQLTKTAFAAKWNALFVDNNNGEITPTVFRSFVADFIDSFLNLEDHDASGVADAISKAHEHTSSMQDIEDAVDLRHEHTSSLQDIEDAVGKQHEHEQPLDKGNDVTFNSVSVGNDKVLDARYATSVESKIDTADLPDIDDQTGATPSPGYVLQSMAYDENDATIALHLTNLRNLLESAINNQNRIIDVLEHHGLIETLV